MSQIPTVPDSGVISFQDGRESVNRDVISRSSLLQSILAAAAAAPGKAKASVDLSRDTFQFWVQSALQPASLQRLPDSNLIKLIRAADYLGDEIGVKSAAQALAISLQKGDIDRLWRQSMLESLSEEQCVHVLRATPVHRLHDFSSHYQRLALKAHYSSVESSKSLDVKLTDPRTTRQCMTKLQSLNLASSGLNAATIGTLLPSICGLPTLYNLDLSGNDLFFEGALLLFEQFSELQQLKDLSLAHTLFDRAALQDHPEVGDEEDGGGVEPSAWRHKLIVPMLVELAALERLDISGELDGDGVTQLAVIKILKELKHFKELVSDTSSLVQYAGQAPGAAAASNGALRAGGLQATLAAPPFLPRLRAILHTDPDQQLLEGSSESALYDVTHPQGDRTPAFSAPHCTSLWLGVVGLHSQAELIAAELSAVSHIPELRMMCIGEGGGAPSVVADSDLVPFAGMLSSFQALTELEWVDHPKQTPRLGAAGGCVYAGALGQSLRRLEGLQALSINTDIPDEGEATELGGAIACLTALTRLELESASRPLVAALTPHLPALSLRSLVLDMRAEGYTGTSNFPPYMGDFARNAVHLQHLTSLSIRAFNVCCLDICSLTEVLRNNSGLESVVLCFLGNRQQLALQSDTQQADTPQTGTRQASTADRKVLEGLCGVLRALPLRTLALEFDAWMRDTEQLLFKPSGHGLSPDPCWSKLKSCSCCVLAPWPQSKLISGGAVFVPLCSAEHLQCLELRKCHITADTFQRPLLQTYFPSLEQLRIAASMATGTAKLLGEALAGVSLPCLSRLDIEVFPEEWLEVDWFGMMEHGTRQSPRQDRGNRLDAQLRHILRGLRDTPLPSLRTLTLTASTRRTRAAAPQQGPSAQREQQAHMQDGHAFGTALGVVLRAATRLQELTLCTLDVGKECVELIAPCISGMQALSSIKLCAADIDLAGATALLEHACKHTALAELSFDCCWVHDECLGPQNATLSGGLLGPLSQWLLSLPELRKLEFSDCDMGMLGEHLMGRNLSKLEKVAEVRLAQCTLNPNLTEVSEVPDGEEDEVTTNPEPQAD